MKSHPFAFGTVVICLFFVFGSCNTFITPIEGLETTVQKSFDFKDFSCVQLTQGFEAEIIQANDFGVSVEISNNLEQYLIAKVVNDTLYLGMKEEHTFLRPVIYAQIQLPLLIKLIARNKSIVY
ncbi:MAG: DUF2807 domain-containing protein [Bacteroidetes bacterium]|nr:DUF2807 domain-containing protein [Bacteroidota bacterium]